jgi:hypothetical protein
MTGRDITPEQYERMGEAIRDRVAAKTYEMGLAFRLHEIRTAPAAEVLAELERIDAVSAGLRAENERLKQTLREALKAGELLRQVARDALESAS